MLVGLEKKLGNKERASSRTQAMRNDSTGNNLKVIKNKLQNVKAIHEKNEDALESIKNAKSEDYYYDFDDDDKDRKNHDVPENSDKPEYYYYYYYDYLDSGIDISHELSNSETAGYEPMPTPLWQVSQYPNNSTESEDDKERENLSKSEITYVSDNTKGGVRIQSSILRIFIVKILVIVMMILLIKIIKCYCDEDIFLKGS